MVHLLKSVYVDKFFSCGVINHALSYRTTYGICAKGSVNKKKFKDVNIPFLTFPPNCIFPPKCTSPPEQCTIKRLPVSEIRKIKTEVRRLI